MRSFNMAKLFGTDGIRGQFGTYPLNEELIHKLGWATGKWLLSKNLRQVKKIKLVIAKDTRTSADAIEDIFIKGLLQAGINIIKVGVIPTSCLAYLVRVLHADMGAMISASHNIGTDNGIKFISYKGYKLSVKDEEEIEKILFEHTQDLDSLTQQQTLSEAHIKIQTDAEGLYIEFLKSTASNLNLKGKRIVIDCAQGALSFVAPRLFKELGADLIALNCQPDGNNINVNCGSLHPDVMAQAVVDNNADCGFAFDGDGDRVIMADEKGKILDGDYILAIIARDLIAKKQLSRNTIVTTQMCNIGLVMAIEQMGGRVIKTDVGDKFILERMLKNKLTLGGEQSGHIIFSKLHTAGDGCLTALQILNVMAESDKKLGELALFMYKFPQALVNVKTSQKKPIEELVKVTKSIEKFEKKLGKTGRIFVRYSGTEPLLRIMVEGQDELLINEIANSIAKVADEELASCQS